MSTQKRLIETYQKAQKKLVEIIKRKQAYGSAAAYERSLLRQIQKELKKLKKSSKALVEQLIKENYKTGLQNLIDDLLKDNTAPRLFNMFSELNISQIELITQNANIDLNKAINIVGRRVQDAVREASIEATAEKLTTGQTVREMQKNLEKKLEQQNLTAVEYANGTKMPIEKYAETVARSTTAETQNKAKVIQGQDWGYDLVRFTEHSPTCEVCSMYQGRVYALTKEAANGKYKGSKGQALHFPYLYDTALISGYSTIHPNCRHRLSVLPAGAYTAAEMEEFSRKSMQPFEDIRSDQERKAYAKEQEVKRKRNESRKQYEKIKTVLPNDAPKTFAAFVKMKSAKSERYKELLKDYRTVIGIAKEQESGIINDSNSNYYTITDKAINSVPLVKVDGFTDEQNYLLQEAHKHLLQKAKTEKLGVEMSAVYDMDMKQIGKTRTEHNVGRVGIDNPSEPYIGIHNHGSDETFSISDIEGFIRRNNMRMLTVVGSKGSIYILKKSDKCDIIGFFDHLSSEKEIPIFKGNTYNEILKSKTFISDLNPEETVALKNIIKQFSLNILKEVENYGVKYLQFPITT
ncbi:MAG: hypothetical protein EGR22_06460 [Ruminococcaceae bacterium]|nr:hypothetical protein [Oscillospiraceae bacterium]